MYGEGGVSKNFTRANGNKLRECSRVHCACVLSFQLFIYCEVETEKGCGGENGLTDVRVLYDSIDPDITEKFNRLGVRYWRYLPLPSHPKYKAYTAWHKVRLIRMFILLFVIFCNYLLLL